MRKKVRQREENKKQKNNVERGRLKENVKMREKERETNREGS